MPSELQSPNRLKRLGPLTQVLVFTHSITVRKIMRVKVNLQNILDYSLDTLTGNTRADLLARASEMEASGFELFVKIPDVVGGDTEAPEERNAFSHYSSELPEPEGTSHPQESVDLTDQAYIQNPCSYKKQVIIESNDILWICTVHEMPSKHSVDKDSHAPCLTMDPYNN